MNSDNFEALLERRLSLIRSTLSHKKKEYASSTDRLHNFYRAAQILNISAPKALLGMLSKHLVSVLDIIDNLGKQVYSKEMIDEKIGDSINYFILLEALIQESINYQAHSSIQEEA